MITVSVRQLASAISEADVYRLPDMNEGTEYLYKSLYRRLSDGLEVRFSGISFDSFELEDVDTLREIYSGVLEVNESEANTISRTLLDIPPVVATTAFV